ncbi:MAG: DUF512 domain-containing protein [Anaerolineae bacterium]|nr:DUF512 domain-containing protein [Anaerolineae bacterium]
MKDSVGVITGVAGQSAAERCGLKSGDGLIAMNDYPVRDVIDVQVLGSEPELILRYQRDETERTCSVRRHYGEPLGLTFAEDLFDGSARVCRNRCEFCFVRQMRPGLRPSLYIKDDDYRLSFLHGNYITLTNLDAADWQRIEEQFLSPLYVSVHATDPAVRVDLMRNPAAGRILEQLRRLADLGIEIHTQAVLVPGRNDGAHLVRTITDLAALYPAVRDVTVVPVGLTRWHAPDLRVYEDVEAAAVLDTVLAWQARLRSELGVGFVYPSDEWFLRARAPLPDITAYDDLLPALIENGVGMARRFLDGWDPLVTVLSGLGRDQTWVTGELFAPTLRERAQLFAEQSGARVDVVPVSNRFFGETVTVAGLLTVEDVIYALKARDLGQSILLPGEMFRGPDGCSLDGATSQAVARATNRRVYVVTEQGSSAEHLSWTVRT